MPALQVRDFPEELYRQLKACADREHRSITQQTIVAVEDMVNQRGGRQRSADAYQPRILSDGDRVERIEKRRRIFDALDAADEIRSADVDDERIVDAIRAARDGRADGILMAAGIVPAETMSAELAFESAGGKKGETAKCMLDGSDPSLAPHRQEA